MTHTLAAIFVPIGIAGAALALICALIVAFALARRAAGLAGGAAGVWIVGALLSWASSFADLWLPLLVSLGALGAALVVGGVLRVLIGGVRRRQAFEFGARISQAEEPQVREPRVQEPRVQKPQVQEPRVREPQIQEPRVQEPRSQPTRVAPTQVRAPSPVADGIRAAA